MSRVCRLPPFMPTMTRPWSGLIAVGAFVADASAYSQGTISGEKFALNTAVSAVGVWGGPVGASVAAGYFALDYFYPNAVQNGLNYLGGRSPEDTCGIR